MFAFISGGSGPAAVGGFYNPNVGKDVFYEHFKRRSTVTTIMSSLTHIKKHICFNISQLGMTPDTECDTMGWINNTKSHSAEVSLSKTLKPLEFIFSQKTIDLTGMIRIIIFEVKVLLLQTVNVLT